jgi:hypothetical protein
MDDPVKTSISRPKDQPLSATYGCPEEWAPFSERHQEFLKRFESIEKAIHTAFDKGHDSASGLAKVIYFQGRLAVEEFMEVLLLCGNGYGVGAQKIIRGMFERAVTARYLFQQPEEVHNFLDFNHVTQHKMLVAMQWSTGKSVLPEYDAEIKKQYERVKPQFMVPDCETCGTTRLNHTWSRVDIVIMAQKTKNLWPLITAGYYSPLQQSHSTVGAIFSRLIAPENSPDGLLFDSDAQRNTADSALYTAHIILLDALELQREYFQIDELQQQMQTCLNDFAEMWKHLNEL